MSSFRSSSSVTSGEDPEKMTQLGANASPRLMLELPLLWHAAPLPSQIPQGSQDCGLRRGMNSPHISNHPREQSAP